ncbi:MAG: hypothetical protein AVDCRST_MAG49-3640, partial [uncultured Thermomicrobiales bacterium]
WLAAAPLVEHTRAFRRLGTTSAGRPAPSVRTIPMGARGSLPFPVVPITI